MDVFSMFHLLNRFFNAIQSTNCAQTTSSKITINLMILVATGHCMKCLLQSQQSGGFLCNLCCQNFAYHLHVVVVLTVHSFQNHFTVWYLFVSRPSGSFAEETHCNKKVNCIIL